jgi:hypothetical protein
MDAQTRFDLAPAGEVDATDRRVVANLVVQIGQLALIMFETAHG